MSVTILRTAAGSAPSVSQNKLLRDFGLRVIAADCDPLSVGFVFADAAYRMPQASSSEYFDALVEICRRERVDWVIPSLDEELLTIARRQDELAAIGTRVLTSPPSTLEVCVDKWSTYQFFCQNGIPTPSTWKPGVQTKTNFPVIVKPRQGRGSTSVYVARDERELDFFAGYVHAAVIQEFVTGRELTVDVLADFASHPLLIRPRCRLKTDSGISYKGAVMSHPGVTEWVTKIIPAVGLVGPANIQCFVDESGSIWFTEINARLAGSVALTFVADPSFASTLVRMLDGRSPEPPSSSAKPLVMLRYWSEVYLEPSEADRLCTHL